MAHLVTGGNDRMKTQMSKLFGGIYSGKRVLVTGHTGFKGSWLALWLHSMGAEVIGYSRAPSTNPNHFSLLDLGMESILGDINDENLLRETMEKFMPEVVFHLAAQPLVRYAYRNPVETYESNVLGTLRVCEAARAAKSVAAFVAVTTDKVYDNKEWEWGYREIDRLGGHDPYSASKACAEILIDSYSRSYLSEERTTMRLTTVRAGNVIGGGDWSEDRLIPDMMKAASRNESVHIRNPHATRPWQHVLDCLSGYLLVGKELLDPSHHASGAYNFGPSDEDALDVRTVTEKITRYWPAFTCTFADAPNGPHEAGFLKLDCSKVRRELRWRPIWNSEVAFQRAVEWYRQFYERQDVLSAQDLQCYVEAARKEKVVWVR